jgi:hypothetical protein
VDKLLLRLWNIDQFVAGCGHLAEAGADHQQQVGGAERSKGADDPGMLAFVRLLKGIAA